MNYGNRSEELIQQAMSAYGSLEDGMKEKGSMKLEDFLQSAIGASSSKTTKIPEAQASVRPEAAAVAPVPAAPGNHAQAAIPTDAPVDEAEIEKLRAFLRSMVEFKASDVFIEAGLPLTYRADGHQYRQSSAPLKPADTWRIIAAIYQLSHRSLQRFEGNHNQDDDFSFAIPGVGRFRANIFRQRGTLGAVIRVIPFQLPNPVDYNIPDRVMRIANLQKGLVLVTGPAGAGKSSTLACLIDDINHNREGHVITMEDPIEYVHSHDKCIVTQREVPTDVATFAEAMRSALRESPDILLLGEMRDTETISAAMTAAEMAQLLFSTLHTTSAANTIDRIVDSFPASQQRQIRMQLSMVLQAVISQQLVPTLDGKIVPVFEIMIATPAIRNLIREGKTHQIDSIIAAGAEEGMKTMDQGLFELVMDGIISRETALNHAIHQEALKTRFEAEGM